MASAIVDMLVSVLLLQLKLAVHDGGVDIDLGFSASQRFSELRRKRVARTALRTIGFVAVDDECRSAIDELGTACSAMQRAHGHDRSPCEARLRKSPRKSFPQRRN